jgi:hypothetical protein
MPTRTEEVITVIVKINGDIISNDLKEVYDWFGFDSTCPADIVQAIQSKPKGEKLEIKIDSGGGVVDDGKGVVFILRGRDDGRITHPLCPNHTYEKIIALSFFMDFINVCRSVHVVFVFVDANLLQASQSGQGFLGQKRRLSNFLTVKCQIFLHFGLRKRVCVEINFD